MLSKTWNVIKHNKLIFIIWIVFTILGSLAGVLVDIFMKENSLCALKEQLNSQVIYIVSISLIVAYLSEIITSIKLDGIDLGIEKEKKNYFYDEKIAILSGGILLLVFMLLAYAESTVSYTFQISYLILTFLIGIILFTIKYNDITEEIKLKKDFDKDIVESEENAEADTEKIV